MKKLFDRPDRKRICRAAGENQHSESFEHDEGPTNWSPMRLDCCSEIRHLRAEQHRLNRHVDAMVTP